MTRQEISDYTKFDKGSFFETRNEVRGYFSMCGKIFKNFGVEKDTDLLDTMAEEVIQNRWHCNF